MKAESKTNMSPADLAARIDLLEVANKGLHEQLDTSSRLLSEERQERWRIEKHRDELQKDVAFLKRVIDHLMER